MVAEVLMLARMHKMQQTVAKQRQQAKRKFQQPLARGLLVLPYLSIVSEKTDHMSKLLADVKWRVQGYQGDTEGQPLSNKVQLSQLTHAKQSQEYLLLQEAHSQPSSCSHATLLL